MGMPAFGYAYPGTPPVATAAPTVSVEQEMEMLKAQAESLQNALESITKRMAELDTKPKE